MKIKKDLKTEKQSNLMFQVILLPVIFISLLIASGIYGQYLGKKLTTSIDDVYLKVVAPLVTYQTISSNLNIITIDLLYLKNTSEKAEEDKYLEELKNTIKIVDQLIDDEVTESKGTTYEKDLLVSIALWKKFSNEISPNLNNINYINKNSMQLMNKVNIVKNTMISIDKKIKIIISDILESVNTFAVNSKKALTAVQILGLIIGVIITIPIVKNIKRLLVIIQESKKSMETLLNNLDQGFFIYGSDGRIYPGATKAASTLFGRDPTDLKLTDLLQANSVDEKNKIESWLKLIFSNQLPFIEAKQWGPRAFQKYDNRYIELDFRPILKENQTDGTEKLESVICIASDKTQERKLQIFAEHEQARLNFIANVAMGRELFLDFVKECRTNINACMIEIHNSTPNINLIFRLLHNIKGNTNSFKMIDVSKTAHALESEFANIRDGVMSFDQHKEKFKNEIISLEISFEKFLKENKEFIGDLDNEVETKSVLKNDIYQLENEIRTQLGKSSEVYKSFMKRFVLEDFSIGFKVFEKVVTDLAERLGKNVKYDLMYANIDVCLVRYSTVFSDLIHLFRNAVDHGIEEEYVREDAGKPAKAQIKVSFKSLTNLDKRIAQIIVEDDGGGINVEQIKNKCIKENLLTAEKAITISENEIIQYIFNPGFTTKDEVSEISGRGVGLYSVKHNIELLGGTIHAETKRGEWTKFIIELPIIDQF